MFTNVYIIFEKFLTVIFFLTGMKDSKILFESNRIETLDSDWLQMILDNGNQIDFSGENFKTKIALKSLE